MIQFYFDSVNVGDCLKQNANKYKIGMAYFRILNLPLELQSMNKNIHLLGVFNESDLKGSNQSYNLVMNHFVNMVQELEIDGVTVSSNLNQEVLLFGSIASTAFDNLACHQIVGNFNKF